MMIIFAGKGAESTHNIEGKGASYRSDVKITPRALGV